VSFVRAGTRVAAESSGVRPWVRRRGTCPPCGARPESRVPSPPLRPRYFRRYFSFTSLRVVWGVSSGTATPRTQPRFNRASRTAQGATNTRTALKTMTMSLHDTGACGGVTGTGTCNSRKHWPLPDCYS